MANDLNSVILVGRLTKDLGSDPNGRDFGYTQGGTCKATVSIASNRSRKDAGGQYVDEVSYFDVVIWGKTAESLKPYLTKGQQVAVEGVLKQERWQDQNGGNRSRIVINAMNVQLLGSKQNGNGGQQGFNPNHAYPTAQAAQQASIQAQQGYAQMPQQNYAPQGNFQQGNQQSNQQQNFDTGMGFPEDIPF